VIGGAARAAGVPYIPVMDAWDQVARMDSTTWYHLYQNWAPGQQAANTHPSFLGSYLLALTIYHAITGQSPVGLPDTIPGVRLPHSVGSVAIPQVTAALLQRAAASPVSSTTSYASIRSTESSPSPERFAVRLNEIATNAQTTQAGLFALDSVPKGWLYVPKQCVGTRCPLLVYLHGAGLNGRNSIDRLQRAADRYGLLLLGTTARKIWWNNNDGADMPGNQHMLERALREIGRRVAVDGQKIALVGECNGGFPVHHWGFHNLDIFSRIGTISGELWNDSTIVTSRLIPHTTQTRFFVQESIIADQDAIRAYRRVRELRGNGNTVKYVVSTHGHGGDAANFMLLGRWLTDSWSHGNPSPAPTMDSMPVVTPALAAKVLDAATKFSHENVHIRDVGRYDYVREITVPVGERPTILEIDLAGLAKAYPVVGTDLRAAGLTAHDYNAVRIALVTAILGETLHDVWQDPQGDSGVLGQNMAFVKAHPQVIGALHRVGFFEWP
jgi:poly(3-hydroxybutyrate) depolymerase